MTEDTRKRAAAAPDRREERDALQKAVDALDDAAEGERPEALSQLAQSAREGEDHPKGLTADRATKPRRVSNKDKHAVATRLLQEGTEGEEPDPQEAGADRLPDRIVDRG